VLLEQLGEAEYIRILMEDPDRVGTAGLVLDAAQALLQQGEGFAESATDAFQEVVSDLYDGFLSAEDRRGVKPPEGGTIPPLVKWGNPEFGPYTWPIDATSSLGVGAGIVSLPPAHVRGGLLAWAALGHEAAGHDILNADTGLREELARAIQAALDPIDPFLSEYWSERIDETASDVLGILNMGPAVGIGLIGYFRALNAAFGGRPKLRNIGPGDDPHPADILRGYLASETVRLLKFTGKTAWADALRDETDKDLEGIVLDGIPISRELAQQSAQLVAKRLVTFKASSLEGHSLGELQNWRDSDERKIRRVRRSLLNNIGLSRSDLQEIYAAHVVSAAVVEGLSAGSDIPTLFKRMLGILAAMHDENPSWGPLFVKSPGNISRHVAYVPSPPPPAEGNGAGRREIERSVQLS
jgi:hypothetical protein